MSLAIAPGYLAELESVANPFILADAEYTRDLNMVGAYIKDAAFLYHRKSNLPLEECILAVKKAISSEGAFPFFDPRVEYLDSTSEGNRKTVIGTMSEYVRDTFDKNQVMSATFACFVNADEQESFTAKYAIGEYAGRKANKNKMFEYSKVGDAVNEAIYNNRQNRNKIKLNSISGAHGSEHSALFSPSIHSVLTSTCRGGTQTTNALLERFLSSNRHYFDSNTVIQDIAAIVRLSDLPMIEEAITKYGIVYPTVEYAMTMIKRSTDLYWPTNSDKEHDVIRETLYLLTPTELAAYVYVNDMHSLRELNDSLVRSMFDRLINVTRDIKLPDPKMWMDKARGDEGALIGITRAGRITSSSLDDILKNPEEIETIGLLAYGVTHANYDFGLLYKAFWLTKNMPCNMAEFPDSIRHSVIASDTDSAIFTTQQWVEWYYGEMVYDHRGLMMAAAVTYLCSQVTQHILVQMTRNLGAVDRHIREFQMKNEYLFKFFSLTSMAKHYFASMSAQEGVMLEKLKWEIKGANLKNSKAPADIIARSNEVIKEVAHKVMSGEKIDLHAYLQEIANIEHGIIRRIAKGGTEFFPTVQIKEEGAYKNANSAYLQFPLWNGGFGIKYGKVVNPPYTAIKVNVQLSSKAKMNTWLDEMPDQEIADGIREWLTTYKKDNFGQMAIPKEIADTVGIPAELLCVVDIETMITGIMRSFYLLLESLGYFCGNSGHTRLLYKDYPYVEQSN